MNPRLVSEDSCERPASSKPQSLSTRGVFYYNTMFDCRIRKVYRHISVLTRLLGTPIVCANDFSAMHEHQHNQRLATFANRIEAKLAPYIRSRYRAVSRPRIEENFSKVWIEIQANVVRPHCCSDPSAVRPKTVNLTDRGEEPFFSPLHYVLFTICGPRAVDHLLLKIKIKGMLL